jgi:catechol 2,3-dioxygenase-like lactoylglutathione lyase family enzyme
MKHWVLIILFGCAVQANAAERIAPSMPQFFALSVPDAPRSADWYRRAFGLEVRGEIKPPDGAAHVIILASDELLVEILQLREARAAGDENIQKPQLTHGLFKVGFHVADLDAAVDRLKAMHARFETGIIDDARHRLRFALLRDPDGNYLQLFGNAEGSVAGAGPPEGNATLRGR